MVLRFEWLTSCPLNTALPDNSQRRDMGFVLIGRIGLDHGWKITLDRGLDLFQWFEFSPFNAAAVMQEARMVKGCEINYIRTDS